MNACCASEKSLTCLFLHIQTQNISDGEGLCLEQISDASGVSNGKSRTLLQGIQVPRNMKSHDISLQLSASVHPHQFTGDVISLLPYFQLIL